jgi:RimJ/RimL family protein N-acetyltransferase
VSDASGRVAIVGTYVVIEPATAAHAADLRSLDWLRSLRPVMAGPLVRAGNESAYLVRAASTHDIVGVLDVAAVPGYADVASVSIYTDTRRARQGWALEAYGRLVLSLFDRRVRLIHHEVLEMNAPVQRILRAMGVAPSARLRDHAYVAGRFWDVLVYSYDLDQFDRVLHHVFPRTGQHVEGEVAAPG